MKTRLVIIVILLLILTVLLTRNDERITNTLINIINPLKQHYKNFTQDIEDKSQSYIFQKESIEKLARENRILRQHLLEQTHYIKQVKDIYSVLPSLERYPVQNISITDTISYVKLNSFSQILLTMPKNLRQNKLYGLIQKNVVAGIAQVKNNQLFGYLTSDKMCRFSVFIGPNKAPGIAEGLQQNEMQIKFIPKWYEIKVGDTVVTSGLDAIFFENIPVGIVTKTELHSSYKVAYIKTYSDIFHPKTFFLINDAKATLTENYDGNDTHLKQNYYTVPKTIENNASKPYFENEKEKKTVVSSIPKRIDQTQDDIVEPETPTEEKEIEKKIKKQKERYIPEQNNDQLDLF
ncbi:rod shape-determining protein MreC [Sulfurovum sp. zt1-1]|uniref:Rod shape-determining protein MreC n=1 Tax=Sulfurovum zhangzhouensis TaxID=3019067 RepID=A0ABT7QXS1_9BACT|nr:rod shape-determining protein MreC [Sulfurovum zhangzhouensis]MDM5271628.1 rod shape-determining protein MreC [Sulfurovum zhangzhouensis]